MRHDAQKVAAGIYHRQGHPVVLLQQLNGILLRLVGPECHKLVVHLRLDRRVRLGHDQLPQSQVINQHAGIVHNVHHVDRLGIAPVLADVLEGSRHCPFRTDANVIGSHQAAHRPLRVAQNNLRALALFG